MAAAALAALATVSQPAHADVGVAEVSPDGKGTVGGALLGAELVTFGLAAFDVQSSTAYLVGGGVGLVGGGVGGFFLEDPLGGRGSMFLLAAGLVLAVPTTVFVLNTAAYRPPEGYIRDSAPLEKQNQTPLSGDKAGGLKGDRNYDSSAAPKAHQLALRHPRLPSLVGMDDGVLTVGLPAVALLDVYTPEMRRTYDLKQETEWRVPVLAMRF